MRDGSAVMTPSTSVQIWTSSAPSAAPAIVAVQSDPPRPKVVGEPSSPVAMNPPMTGIVPSERSCGTACRNRSRVGPNRGLAPPCRASLTNSSLESRLRAARPQWISASVTRRLEIRSPMPSRASNSAEGEAPSANWKSIVMEEIPGLGHRTSSRNGIHFSKQQLSDTTARVSASVRSRSVVRRSAPPMGPASAASTRRSVVSPIAETTTRGCRSARLWTMEQTRSIAPGLPTEVPPNFMTIIVCSASRVRRPWILLGS